MTKWNKVLAWGLPILGLAIVVIYATKKSRSEVQEPPPPGGKSNATDSTAPSLINAPAPKTSGFPLQVGSRNDYVKDLQTALGITADGIFGTQTENALRSAAGVNSVRDKDQLAEIIAKAKAALTNTAAATEKAKRADQLKALWNSGNYSIKATATKNWYQVQKDAFGAYNYTGTVIGLHNGITYNKEDYSIADVTKLGNVIIYINKGAAQGSYIGDPNDITLV